MGSSGRPVPVTAGSHRARALEAGGFLISDASFPQAAAFASHFHERAVVGVVLHGGLSIDAGLRHAECMANTVYVEPRGERHAHQVVRGAHIVSLQPDPAQPELIHPLRASLDGIRTFAHAGIAARAGELLEELRSPDAVTVLALEALALDIVTLVARTSDGRSPADPPAWLRHAREYIHDRCTRPLRIDDIAAAAGVHPASLVRAWRQHYRTAIGQYLRTVRLEWTRARLLETDEPLSRIALRAGFADQSHFTRSFTTQYGISPGRYRSSRRRGSRDH